MIVEKEEESIITPKILANRGIVQFLNIDVLNLVTIVFLFSCLFFLSKDILEVVLHKNT